MVGGLLPAAGVLVDAGGDEPVGRLRRGQDVVDADAVVLLPGARLIVPERVDAGPRQAGAHDVGEPEVQERAVGGAGLGLVERIAGPGIGVLGVDRLGDDIIVAEQQERLLVASSSSRVRAAKRCIHASL